MSKRIKCLGTCGRELLLSNSNFYKSNNSEFEKYNGFAPYCKGCLRSRIFDENGLVDIDKFKDTLRILNKPFIRSIFEELMNDGIALGDYTKRLNFGEYRNMTYADSDKEEGVGNGKDNDKKENNKYFNEEELDLLEDKWGFGYTPEEYYYFEKKWKKLIDNYGEKTTLHTEALITYIRFRVREEIATAQGDIKSAKEWGSLAAQAQKDGKLNVSQLSKSDISGGVDLVCQIFEAVESELGIVPLLPRLLDQPYDDVDMIIWSNINYGRILEDKPRISYREIWHFYDEMLEEYCKQQGFNEQQTKEYKARRNNIFRDLQEIYKEPVYDEID